MRSKMDDRPSCTMFEYRNMATRKNPKGLEVMAREFFYCTKALNSLLKMGVLPHKPSELYRFNMLAEALRRRGFSTQTGLRWLNIYRTMRDDDFKIFQSVVHNMELGRQDLEIRNRSATGKDPLNDHIAQMVQEMVAQRFDWEQRTSQNVEPRLERATRALYFSRFGPSVSEMLDNLLIDKHGGEMQRYEQTEIEKAEHDPVPPGDRFNRWFPMWEQSSNKGKGHMAEVSITMSWNDPHSERPGEGFASLYEKYNRRVDGLQALGWLIAALLVIVDIIMILARKMRKCCQCMAKKIEDRF